MKIHLLHIVTFAVYILSLCSCKDDPIYDIPEIPEGTTEFTAQVSFRSFVPALESRSAGNAIKSINELWIAIYETDGENWSLRDGGLMKITADTHNLKTEIAENGRPDGEASSETATGHATFTYRLPNGIYKIYAIANMDMSDVKPETIGTPQNLKDLKLEWDETDLSKNSEMFGYFTNNDIEAQSENNPDNETVIISPNRPIHAWLKRAASKVTIAFDGTNLNEGVYIYPLTVTVKDIAPTCNLGSESKVEEAKTLIRNGEILKLNNDGKRLPPDAIMGAKGVIKRGSAVPDDAHSESAPALYFYENMQGDFSNAPDKEKYDKRQDRNNIGTSPVEGENEFKDNVAAGTYIEVEAVYCSAKSSGLIIYRFMLGKDVYYDYNAERNHHYKLTLRFKGNANDIDWHIDYKEQVLEVTQPKVFNYQGLVFMPNYLIPNGGHNFIPENAVVVSSYLTNNNDRLEEWTVDYSTDGGNSYNPTKPAWLTVKEDDGKHPYEKILTFTAEKIDSKSVTINDYLKEKGNTKANPINLADPKRATVTDPSTAKIICTANCYMVDGPGWYLLPLVYGNAIHKEGINDKSYQYSGGTTGGQVLYTFKNYKGDDITSPYIVKDLKEKPGAAFLVWQDVDNLVEYDQSGEVWLNNRCIEYLPDAYGGVGGIRFHVTKKQEGNSVIAIGKNLTQGKDETMLSELPDIFWSWHIWVTSLSAFNDEDKTIEITAHDTSRKFEIMPVNLGWCSGGNPIYYYPGRKCKVRFKAGNKEKVIEIVQKSHIAVPTGNNTYYQWGRKDPFIGALGQNNNKTYYIASGRGTNQYLPMITDITLNPDSAIYNTGRITSIEAVNKGELIKKPYKWHNPPAKPGPTGGLYDWLSDNRTYCNLWVGRPGVDPNAVSLKTIYDPCPVGYQVPHYNAFTGFTTTGNDPGLSQHDGDAISNQWYDVWLSEIPDPNPKDNLFEFYTNPDKVQSVIFPTVGYRDWNSYGSAMKYGTIGYLWGAGNMVNNDDSFYNFEFSHKDNTFEDPRLWGGYVRPCNTFYPCDGFPVRPCLYDKHE